MAYPYYVNKNRPNHSSHLIVIHTIPKAEYACWRGNLLILFHPVLEIISCVEGRERETQAPAASAACGNLLNLDWQHGDSEYIRIPLGSLTLLANLSEPKRT